MRNLILCAIAFLGMANFGYGQQKSNASDYLHLMVFDQAGQVLKDVSFIGSDANEKDMHQLITDNLESGKVVLKGKFTTDLQIDIIDFNSDNLKDINSDWPLCQVSETVLKPIIGVVAESTDDLNGVGIQRIIENSSASDLEMSIEDIILSFNGSDLVSPCELQHAVRQCEVGQVVTIVIEKDGQVVTQEITIGARVYNTISFEYCPQSNDQEVDERSIGSNLISSLSAYPNPTNGISTLSYTTSSNSPVAFYVFDMYGKTIHMESFTEVNGEIKIDYDFNGTASGTYLMAVKQNDDVYKTKVIYSKQ